MTASEVLRKARALIEKPENWTQRVRARDANGFETGVLAPTAAAWYSDGALGEVCCRAEQKTWFQDMRAAQAQLDRAAQELGSKTYVGFNDTHTHAEVLSLFDRAIAAAEARGE